MGKTFCHEVAEAGILDDLAQGTAAACYQHDDTCGHHSFFHLCQGGRSVKAIAQCENSYDQAEADCDDGLAEEDQDTHDTGLHAECGCNSVDEDQDDGQEQGHEGLESSGNTGHIHAESSVIIGFLIRSSVRLVVVVKKPVILLGKDKACIDDAGDGHGQCQNDREKDEETDIDSEDTADAQRAGCGRNQGVGDDQACCQGDAQSDDRLLGCFGKSLCDGCKDDETGITEDRDGYQETCECQGFFFTSLAEQLEEGVGHSLGRAGDFEDLSHHDTETDDDTDASQRAAEARSDRIDNTESLSVLQCDVQERHTADDTDQDRCGDQSQEGLDLCFQNHDDQKDNADRKGEQHSLSA